MNKLIYSDHTPTCTSISVNPVCSLNLLYECSVGLSNYNHYDINKRRTCPLIFSKIDWAATLPKLEEQSRLISDHIDNNVLDNDQLDALLASTIYGTCKKHYRKQSIDFSTPINASQYNSRHLKAIAEMNFFTYKFHVENGDPTDICNKYMDD